MTEETHIALLTEIRDLQRQQLDAMHQTLANQAQMLSAQQLVMKRQADQLAINARVRRWTRIAVWVGIALLFLWVLQPWLFLLSARSMAEHPLR